MNNIIDFLFEHLNNRPEQTAIRHKNKSISYKELALNVKSTALYLKSKGIRKGDRILIFVPMSIELYQLLLAIFYLGAIAVFMDAWSTKKRLELALEIASCKAIVTNFKTQLLRFYSSKLRKLPINIILSLQRFHHVTPQALELQPAETSLTDTALITFTTGSTGIPKAAKRTHGFLLAQYNSLKKHLSHEPDDIDLTTMPIFILHNLAIGITSIIPDFDPRKPEKINPGNIISEFKNFSVTTTTGSPVFYVKLADFINMNKIEVKLNRIFLGGAPVFPSAAKKLIRAFPDTQIEIVYGSTEAEPISSITAEKLINFPCSISTSGLPVGKPVENIDIRIIEIKDNPIQAFSLEELDNYTLPNGRIGEICVSGEHVLKEYINNKPAELRNKIKLKDGTIWHRTGDSGYIDNQYNLFLTGRVNSRIFHKGKYFYVFPIEQALCDIPEIEVATILAIQGKLSVIVELKTESNLTKDNLEKKLNKLNIDYEDIVFIKKIPRDPRHNSKIDYEQLNLIYTQQ